MTHRSRREPFCLEEEEEEEEEVGGGGGGGVTEGGTGREVEVGSCSWESCCVERWIRVAIRDRR